MNEKIIYLEGIDPVNIYGVKNSRIESLKSFFPKLKIVARGNEVKIFGDDEEILKFEEKFFQIVQHYEKYNNITESDIKNIMNSVSEKDEITDENFIIFGKNGKFIQSRTKNQYRLVNRATKDDLIFAVGPAGTGKTYTAIALAVRAYRNKEVKRIIISRPAVEAGESLGFLPGELKEKLDPYLQPLYDALFDMIPAKKLEEYFEQGIIQIAPLAFMRGRTLSNAFVILDEAQNATINQLKMFLTRMGMGSKFIVTGDITQIDLPKKNQSGLLQAIKILDGIKGISIIHFDRSDIVRHQLVKDIVDAYHDDEEKMNGNSKKENK
jgi:phosphate starvation-inducible protein PhoH and related proteins